MRGQTHCYCPYHSLLTFASSPVVATMLLQVELSGSTLLTTPGVSFPSGYQKGPRRPRSHPTRSPVSQSPKENTDATSNNLTTSSNRRKCPSSSAGTAIGIQVHVAGKATNYQGPRVEGTLDVDEYKLLDERKSRGKSRKLRSWTTGNPAAIDNKSITPV